MHYAQFFQELFWVLTLSVSHYATECSCHGQWISFLDSLTSGFWYISFLWASSGKFDKLRYLEFWYFGLECHYVERKRCLFKEKSSFYLFSIEVQLFFRISKCNPSLLNWEPLFLTYKLNYNVLYTEARE